MILVVIAIFGFLYFQKEPTKPGEEDEGTNFISQFNPFGRPAAEIALPTAVPSETVSTNDNVGTGTLKLERVSSMPIAGFTLFNKERFKEVPISPPLGEVGEGSVTPNPTLALPKGKGTKLTPPSTEFQTAVRYVDKATGNIYQTFVDKMGEQKFSTTTIFKVYDAYFGNQGKSVIMRYLKGDERTIETFVGTLPKELLGEEIIENNEIKGSFLPNNIKDLSASPDGSKIFYLFNSGNSQVGTILNLLNNKKIQVFDSPFTEWLSQWPNNNMITLSTKPSSSIPGYMYKIDSTGKNLTKVLGEINGLTTLTSPNGKLVLHSNNNLLLSVYHSDSRNSDILGVKTLPEKCVWDKMSDFVYCAVPKLINFGEYPDTWYQGEVLFSDQFWKIDIKTGNATLLLNPTTIIGSEEIDALKLTLDVDENYLFFVNKKDSFLWKLELK